MFDDDGVADESDTKARWGDWEKRNVLCERRQRYSPLMGIEYIPMSVTHPAISTRMERFYDM